MMDAHVNHYKASSSVKVGSFFEQLNNYQLFSEKSRGLIIL
jgi:hypothetical protein